ncbi:uncharacterized protein LOC141634533 [Silene latifolia]|uniref:uncharacterized protein LOC141634533 n=1 Tax=Silene latifolia TaxID=37657 RepID=UPI003D76B416
MPTFSAIQLDRFLEPGATTNTTTAKTTSLEKKNENLPLEDAYPKLERRNTTSLPPLEDFKSSSSRRFDVPQPHPQLRRRNSVASTPQFSHATVRPPITPALYTTPEPTPLPVSPTSSFPPFSPFLINHKRRGPRLSKSFSEHRVVDAVSSEVGHTRSLSEENVSLEQIEDALNEAVEKSSSGENGVENRKTEKMEEEEAKGGVGSGLESDDFFDPQESMSFSSSIDTEDCGGVGGAERSAKANTPMGEFYDAWEELSSDSGQQSTQRSLSDVETELREMRLTLLIQIEKRKQVEETVHSMQSQWQMLREKLGTVGVILPADLAVSGEGSQSDVSLTEDICRQIHLARFVSESIGRGIARAEVEAKMEAQLEVKNFEIARLFDRLHYYETMNREMSQMNQEAVEIARRDRHKRRRRQKWVWGSIVTAITLGSAALVWSYLPGGNTPSTLKYADASEPNSNVQ